MYVQSILRWYSLTYEIKTTVGFVSIEIFTQINVVQIIHFDNF